MEVKLVLYVFVISVPLLRSQTPQRNMDVRTGLIVLFCLMGFTCAEPVKFIDCGKFHLNNPGRVFPSLCVRPVVDSDVQFNEPYWGNINRLQQELGKWFTLMCYSETCVKVGKIGFQEQRWRIPISFVQQMFAVFSSCCLNLSFKCYLTNFIIGSTQPP